MVAVPTAGLGAGDREGLVDLDGDLVAGLGGDVGFVDAVGVGLDAFDGGAGVLPEGGGFHLGGNGSGQSCLAGVPGRARRAGGPGGGVGRTGGGDDGSATEAG